eukprot:3430899-Prymnesium_polylepis.1
MATAPTPLSTASGSACGPAVGCGVAHLGRVPAALLVQSRPHRSDALGGRRDPRRRRRLRLLGGVLRVGC